MFSFADLNEVQLLVCYHLGTNHCDAEEPSAGEKYLNQARARVDVCARICVYYSASCS